MGADSKRPRDEVDLVRRVHGAAQLLGRAPGEAAAELRKLGPLPTEILRETQIGKLVNQAAKVVDDSPGRSALQELLDEWKQEYRKARRVDSKTEEAEEADELSLEIYKKRLADQQKYYDRKPGTRSVDNCLQDPPTLPPPVTINPAKASEPARSTDGHFHFPDFPAFQPNLSPKQVLQMGSFGGTYFRSISSAVTGKRHEGKEVIKEFPQDWFHGLIIEDMVTSPDYRKTVNKYGVACGGSLGMWETSGWITAADPYGWFQWYCRFFQGRRSSDDGRQVDRWLKGQGPKGRWRLQLMNKIITAKTRHDDAKISPVMRQVLLHWAYELTSADLEKYREAQLKKA